MRKILSVLLMFMFVISFVVAIDDLMTLQGNIKESGVNLASGNISVYIFTTATGGNVIWNSTLNGKDDFNNSISDGKYDLLLGNITGNELTLEYGQLYYLEMFVNEEGFSFNGSDRQVFQSSVGQINGSFIGANQINKTHFNGNLTISQIDGYENLVFSNDSVTFDSGFNVTVGSGGWFFGIFNWVIDVVSGSTSYFTFNGTTLTFDEDKLNSTIDSRSSAVANLSTKNIFDQAVNKTSNVLFGNLTVTGNFSANGSTLYVDPNTARVGIGTTSPDNSLHVKSADNVVANFQSTTTGVALKIQDSTRSAFLVGKNNLLYISPTSGTLGSNAEIVFDYVDGKLGIGTITPEYLLEADGNFSANKTLFVTTAGNVGIGTAAPLHTLDVRGDVNVSGKFKTKGIDVSDKTIYVNHIGTGNVGINNNNPGVALDIIGDMELEGTFINPAAGHLELDDDVNVSGDLKVMGDALFSNLTSTGNLTVAGIAEFGGGWQAGGVTITGGDIYLESLFVVNITALGVTNLEVNGSLFPELNNTFDLGNGSHIWRNGYFGGEVYIGGSAVSTWLYNQTELGSFNFNQSDIAFNYNQTNINGSLWNVATGGIQYNGGNVGIGTLSPANELNIVGDPAQLINLTSTNSGSPKEAGIVLGSGGEEWRMAFDQNARNGDLTFRAINSVVGQFGQNGSLQVDGNIISDGTDPNYFLGSIGIGTASPATELDIYDSSSPELRIRTSVIDGRLSADTTNGLVLYPTTEHTLSLGSNGTKDTIVITSDRVGIGTASPDYELEVVGDIGIDANLYHNNDDNTYMTFAVDRARIYAGNQIIVDGDEDEGYARFGDGVLDVHVGSTSAPGTDATLFIGGLGGSYDAKVGIGTVSPTAILQVGSTDAILIDPTGTAQLSTLSGNAGGLRISSGTLTMDSAAAMNLDYNTRGLTGGRDFRIKHDGTVVFTIEGGDNIGNVGIGTTSPLGLLHIETSTAGAIAANTNADELLLESSGNTGLTIYSSTTGLGGINFGDSGDDDIGRINYDHSTNSLDFYTGGSEKMIIESTGDVGIGTGNPTYDLHVNRSGDAILALESKNNGSTSGIQFIRERQSAPGIKGGCIGLDSNTGTNNAEIFMDVDTSLNCGQTFGNQQRFSINSDGNAFFGNLNVGIGTTSPSAKLHVVGDVFITSNIVVGDNVHEDAFNVFGNGALSDANDAGEIEGIDDVFISGNLEVHDKFFLTGGSAAIESGDIAENLLTVKGREAILCNGDPNCIAKSYEKELDFGEVVCINPKVGQTITRCTEANSHLVAGVLSNTTSLFMGNSGKYGNPVAVAGIVWTKVNIEGGEILPGDLLVTSSKPGYAMKNTNPKQGTLLGKAYDFCTPREANEEGECDILMFVALG